jgi:hypothetical protein
MLILSIATFISTATSLTPSISFFKACKTADLEEISHSYIVMANINTINTLVYAAKIEDWDLFNSTLVLTPIFFTYIVMYHVIAGNMKEFFVKGVLLEFAILVTLLRYATSDLMGILMMAGTFFTYASTMEKI